MDENMVMETAATENETVVPERITGFVSGCKKLNVRTRPRKTAEVMAILDAGSEVVIEASLRDWHQVTTASGITGFCMREYITIR